MKTCRNFCRWGVLVAAFAFAVAAEASDTRKITLRWKQDGDVAGFMVYRHTYLKPWDSGLDVGLPEQVDGVYICEIEVSDSEATWIAVASYNRVRQFSQMSESKVYLLPES